MHYINFTLMFPVALVLGIVVFAVVKDPTKLTDLGKVFRPAPPSRKSRHA